MNRASMWQTFSCLPAWILSYAIMELPECFRLNRNDSFGVFQCVIHVELSCEIKNMPYAAATTPAATATSFTHHFSQLWSYLHPSCCLWCCQWLHLLHQLLSLSGLCNDSQATRWNRCQIRMKKATAQVGALRFRHPNINLKTKNTAYACCTTQYHSTQSLSLTPSNAHCKCSTTATYACSIHNINMYTNNYRQTIPPTKSLTQWCTECTTLNSEPGQHWSTPDTIKHEHEKTQQVAQSTLNGIIDNSIRKDINNLTIAWCYLNLTQPPTLNDYAPHSAVSSAMRCLTLSLPWMIQPATNTITNNFAFNTENYDIQYMWLGNH